ncbi:MAG: hypothetical protein NTZ05_07120 [Chloroflexi bacterium]|nr:hypothetical protein [Chloroflexota bacterium]
MEPIDEQGHRAALSHIELRLIPDRQRREIEQGGADQRGRILADGALRRVDNDDRTRANPGSRVDGGPRLADNGPCGAAPGEPLHFGLHRI